MKFGAFDHIDANGMSIGAQYAQRLDLVERYEALGFHCYHLAEHHATQLGMTPSPGVFLAAVAQRTKTLRFGPLVYLLPLHHPVRLLEEIGMLDQMSGGRLQLGIGKGGQPFEHSRFGVAPSDLDALFAECFEILMKGLGSDAIEHQGRFYQLPRVPQVIQPVQRPHPPLWYGTGNPERAGWAAQHDINLMCLMPDARTRVIADTFGEALDKLGKSGPDKPLMGVARQVIVAPTDAEAERIATRVWLTFARSFNWLVNWLGEPAFPLPPTYAAARDMGMAFAGSPAAVRDWVAATRAAAGVDYLVTELVFGDQSEEEARQNVELFGTEVMPAFAD